MKNSNTLSNENFEKGCIHSQICSTGTDDFIYRKSYQGDWGDWDETPESSNTHSYDMSECENAAVSDSNESETAYENSHL